MQTNPLSIQSGPNANNVNNANAAGRDARSGNGASQFGAMLSNEMVQRQAPLPLPAAAPAPKAEAAKPQSADKPAQADETHASSGARAAKTEETKTDAGQADAASDDDADDGAAKADPAAEMLALMASLQQPAQDAAASKGKASAASQAFDALGGGKARRGDVQLAALQAAMKSVAKEPGQDAGATGKAFSAAALKNPALAAAGAGLGADADAAKDTAATAADGADLRAVLGGAVKLDARPQLDAADLALQQAREAALQASAQADASPVAVALAQPAMLEAAEAAAAAGEALSARVGTSQWENQVGQKVVYMVGSEEQTASLTLNPPDLGPLQVVLSVSNDQASVTFSSNQEEVRQALENALPRLREMMSESGIALGNASVNAGMPDGRQAQDPSAQPDRGSGRDSSRNAGRSSNGSDGAGGIADTARPVTRTAILGDRGMVDTFA